MPLFNPMITPRQTIEAAIIHLASIHPSMPADELAQLVSIEAGVTADIAAAVIAELEQRQ